MKVLRYSEEFAHEWNDFCTQAGTATFLHRRDYLSYHEDRFEDCSVILRDGDTWLGVLPAARSPGHPDTVVSHPGITFGGMLHGGGLSGARMIEALTLVCEYFRRLGYKGFLYKCVPGIYHRTPSQDDLYALFRLGAKRTRCDLSSAIDLANRRNPSKRRQRSLKKAVASGATVGRAGTERIGELWSVLTENLSRKHRATPVHTESEMKLLAERFPENIRFVTAALEDRLEAGVVLYITEPVHHAQYISASETGYRLSLLDLVFEHCIAEAADAGARYFDFGISNKDQGRVLNDGLYLFKTEFGGGGVVHEFYALDL